MVWSRNRLDIQCLKFKGKEQGAQSRVRNPAGVVRRLTAEDEVGCEHRYQGGGCEPSGEDVVGGMVRGQHHVRK